MRAFTVLVMELNRMTAKRSPQRFAATAVTVDVLEQLGTLLIDIANSKKSKAITPVPLMAQPDNGIVLAGQLVVKAEPAAASSDMVA